MKEDPVEFSYTPSFEKISILVSIFTPMLFAIAALAQKPGSFLQFDFSFLALINLVWWWQLRRVGRPVVVLTDTGLTDHRWTSKEIPWPAVKVIGIHPTPGSKAVVLDIDPTYPGLTWWVRTSLRMSAWLATRVSARFSPGVVAPLGPCEDGIWISARGLDADLETFYAAFDSRRRHAGAQSVD